MSLLNNDWNEVLGEEFTKPYYKKLHSFLKQQYESHSVYPAMNDLFNAFHFTSYSATKVVILGQDPYHGPNQAHGLSFSVKTSAKIPPSLRNMYKELNADIGCSIPHTGYLVPWAEQGVLMLNTVLSVRKGEPGSHKGEGWELFTDAAISALNNRMDPIIFVLWGRHAQMKKALITKPQHQVLQGPHPSPFSAYRGFFGSRPFSTINQILTDNGRGTINWQTHDEGVTTK